MNPSQTAQAIRSAMSQHRRATEPSLIFSSVMAVLIWHGRAYLYSDAVEAAPQGQRARLVAAGWIVQRTPHELCGALDAAIADMRRIAERLDHIASLMATGEAEAYAHAVFVCRIVENIGAALRYQAWDSKNLACPEILSALEQARNEWEKARAAVLIACPSWLALHIEARARIGAANREAREDDCLTHWVALIEASDEAMREDLGDVDGVC